MYIQRQLTKSLQRQQKSDDGAARIFSKLMMEGKVRAAPSKKSTIITPDTPLVEPHPVLFDEINAQVIPS